MSNLVLTFIDNDSEKASFSINTGVMTNISYVTITDGVDVLVPLVEAMTLGELTAETLTHHNTKYAPLRPTDPYANRESAVVFYMTSVSNAQNKMRVSLPAPALAKFPFAALGVGRVDAPFGTLHADLTALIGAIEAVALFTNDAGVDEAVIVTAMEFIGRNL